MRGRSRRIAVGALKIEQYIQQREVPPKSDGRVVRRLQIRRLSKRPARQPAFKLPRTFSFHNK